jgi:tetratricopeptide (TPR) repeat protein
MLEIICQRLRYTTSTTNLRFGLRGLADQTIIFLFAFILALMNSIILPAQNIMSLFENSLKPPPDFANYEPVTFKWKMDGKTQVFMNEGLNSLDEHKVTVARENFSKVIELEPKFFAGHYFRGVCNKLLLETEAAESDFTNAIDYNDTLSAAHIELGEIFEERAEFDKAKNQYTKAMKLSPHSPSAPLHLGNLAFVQDDFAKAKEHYKTCNELKSNFPTSYFMMGLLSIATKDKDAALLNFNQALKADSIYAQALFWRGLLLADKLEEQKALADWNKLVNHNPSNPLFLYMRGYLYIQLDEFDKAFTDLRKSFMTNSESEDRFVGGQTIMDKRIDLQTAARYLIQKLYGMPEPDADYIKKGFCYLLSARYQAAYNWFSKIKTQTGISVYLRGLTLEHSGQHNVAYIAYDHAIELDPEIFDAYKKRGIYQIELRKYDAAIKDFNEMIRLQPELLVSYRLRGLTKALADDCPGAMSDLTKFIDRDSSDRESLTTRGSCLEKTRQWAKAAHDFHRAFQIKRDVPVLSHAVDDYQKALKADEGDHATRFSFGKLLMAVGERERALKQIKLASDKNYLPAKNYLKAMKKDKA